MNSTQSTHPFAVDSIVREKGKRITGRVIAVEDNQVTVVWADGQTVHHTVPSNEDQRTFVLAR